MPPAAEAAIALADAESEIEHCLLPFPIQSIRERAREGPRPKLFFVSKATQIFRHKVARNVVILSATIILLSVAEMQSIIGIRVPFAILLAC